MTQTHLKKYMKMIFIGTARNKKLKKDAKASSLISKEFNTITAKKLRNKLAVFEL